VTSVRRASDAPLARVRENPRIGAPSILATFAAIANRRERVVARSPSPQGDEPARQQIALHGPDETLRTCAGQLLRSGA
jgi:hypothetical protein